MFKRIVGFSKKYLLLIFMFSILLFSTAYAAFNYSVTVPSTGLIINNDWAVSSQMRGVFIAQQSLGESPDFYEIADTLASYDINTVYIEIIKNYETCYPSSIVPLTVYPAIDFEQCIDAFHAKGIQVYAHFDTMYKAYNGDGISRNCYYIPFDGTLDDLQLYYGSDGWLDIANPASVSLIKGLIEELVSNYNIDGITFDYTRWSDGLMPLGDFDKQQFIVDTGLTNVVWPSDVVPVENGGTGIYYNQFLEWRTSLINDFVKNMTEWSLAINPTLKFGASPHGYGLYDLSPSYWILNEGQDINYWISQGYIDWVAPMIYSNETSDFELCVQAINGNATGGPNGVVPIYPFISNQFPVTYSPDDFVRYVNTILSSGGDGWILWEYGGPGDNSNCGSPDIRPYLSALGLPDPVTFDLKDVNLQKLNSTAFQVSWITTSLANGTVEYSLSPLYSWSKVTDPKTGFDYYKVAVSTGAKISNSTLTTNHSFIINGVDAPFYFKISSGDLTGIATVYELCVG